MKRTKIVLTLSALLLAATNLTQAAPLGTTFTYQGSLQVGGAAATGNYDMTFALFNDPTVGAQFGTTWTNLNISVSNGLFTTTVDFGPGIFDGTAYWMAIGVRSNGLAVAFSALAPRQPVSPSPYALFATVAPIADNSVTSAKILDGTIATGDLGNNSVTSIKIVDGTIVAADLADGSVTSAKILDGTIATVDLADNSVTTAKVVDGTLLGADLAANTVTSVQLADSIDLGAAALSGVLNIYRTAASTPGITLTGSGSQISTFGSDGLEQIRLWGPSYGEIYLFDNAALNGRAVTLSANGSAGGYLQLNNTNSLARARLDGANTGGALTLYQADGGIGVFVDGESSGAGYLDLRGTNGATRVSLDGSGNAFGGQVNIYSADGGNGILLYGDVGGGALEYLYTADGSLGIALDGDSGGAGYIAVYNTNTATRIGIDGFSSNGGGEISVYDASTTETIELLGAYSSTLGGVITLRQGDGTEGVRIYSESYAGDGGLISVKNAAGTEKIEIDGDDGDGGPAIRLHNAAGTTTITLDGDSSGDGRITTQELQITGGSDLSEQFDINTAGQAPVPGMVVCIDPKHPGQLIPSQRAYDRTVAGVISGAGGIKPGMLMGQKGTKADGQHPVALTGRVYVQADATNGAIQPGDLLTSSSVLGHAMKVTDHARAQGAILGKAMTGLDKGEGTVLVLVSLQ